MDFNNQNDRGNQGSFNSQAQQNGQNASGSQNFSNGQNNLNEQNNPYGSYIPSEIPIPDMKDAKNAGPSYQQNYPHQRQNMESPYGQNNQYQGPMYMPKEQKKGTAVKILIAVACAVVVIFAVVGIGIVYFRSTPAYKLGRAFRNLSREMEEIKNPLAEKIGTENMMLMMAEEGSHISTRINFTAESLYGTTLGIDTECYKDVTNKELSADTSISMMNYEFAHLNIYADEEALCFSIPELFMEDMYIDNENVVSQYNRSFLAELTGISDTEDFSLDLFADGDGRVSLEEWRTINGFAQRYREDIEGLKDKLILEKAEKGFYRIVYPAEEMDHLLKNMMDSYESLYAVAGEEKWWEEYDRLIDSDISVLFEIDRQNRIDSIALEEPVKMLDGTATMEASVHFLGDDRSIDKVQGELTAESGDGVERSIHFQVIQTPSEDAYSFDMDMEFMEERESLLRMKMVSNSDAARDEFDMSFSIWDDEEDAELILEGSLDDIVSGSSLVLDLEEISFNMNGDRLFKITGDISIEPFDGEVSSTVKKRTAFFEMTEDDWLDILYEIDDAYGGLLNYLW